MPTADGKVVHKVFGFNIGVRNGDLLFSLLMLQEAMGGKDLA